MTVATGTASDVFDLLSKIGTFAGTTLGWTVNKTTADEIYIQNGTDYWALKATNNVRSLALTVDGGSRETTGSDFNAPGIACIGSRGFDDGLTWINQPNAHKPESALGVFHQTDIKEYIFLSNSAADYIHILARRDAVNWTTMILGSVIEKHGVWTGGQYLGAGNIGDTGTFGDVLWESTVAFAFMWGDLDAPRWYSSRSNVTGQRRMRTFYTPGITFGMSGRLHQSSPSDWNGRAPMFPLMSFFDTTGSFDAWVYAGAVPDVRHMFTSFMPNGTEFVVGADTWIFVNNLAFKKIT